MMPARERVRPRTHETACPEGATSLFAFGTLKRGFPLHESALAEAGFLGPALTFEPYPLVIAGDWYAPMLFDEPGVGLRVVGEVYEVSSDRLELIDALESVGLPGNLRISIRVELLSDGRSITTVAYAKHRRAARPLHSGYLSCYRDCRFIPFEERATSPRPDDAYLFRAGDRLIRRLGPQGASAFAARRRDVLNNARLSAAATTWARLVQILSTLSRGSNPQLLH